MGDEIFMRLVIGGAYQGKKDWVMEHWAVKEEALADGAIWDGRTPRHPAAMNHFHLLVRRWMESGAEPEKETEVLLRDNPEIVIITDEIGSGIVPLDPAERQYREVHGRICCLLAAQADEMVRVFCGMGQKIK